jgi:prephenate dehydrogenase
VDASLSLRDVSKDADVVFLSLPLGELHDVLAELGPKLKPNAVLLDTAPVKADVIRWVRELVPAGRYHVGLVPAITPARIAGSEWGVAAAHQDLFKGTVMMVVTPPDTPAAVEQLGMNVARLLGAKPMLTDPAEADGIMISAHVLPQLSAGAVLEACTGESGWTEARKLAGRPFATVTGGMAYFDDPASIQAASLAASPRVVHSLDVLLAALQGLRDDIANGDGGRVEARLQNSHDIRERWLKEREQASWLSEGAEPVDVPGLGEQMAQMILGGRAAEAARRSGARP